MSLDLPTGNPRSNYPPIDMCQMAMEVAHKSPDDREFLAAVIDVVKASKKFVAPFDVLRTVGPDLDDDYAVPEEPTFLAVTVGREDDSGMFDIYTGVWVPAKSDFGKVINRHFERPKTVTGTDFCWVLSTVQTPEGRYEFNVRAQVVPNTRQPEMISDYAPYKKMPKTYDASAAQEQEQRTAVVNMTAMNALLKLQKQIKSDPEAATLGLMCINCGTEPEFARIIHAFGTINAHTWDMNVVAEHSVVSE